MATKEKKNPIQIEYLKVNDLIPYINNPKDHPEEQIDKIAGSIVEFGFLNPVILDKDNNIIVGHGRILAAKKLKLKEVPCIRAENLTPAQVKAYRIADNRLSELGKWDDELLKIEVESLKAEDYDVTMTGYDFAEIDKILADESGTITEKIPKEKEHTEENTETEHKCPKCGYEF